jgi:ferredoxin
MESAVLRERLDDMAKRGLIGRHGRAPNLKYGKLPFVVGIYEGQVNRLTEQLERDVLQYFDEAFSKEMRSTPTPQMRTVPVNVDIAVDRGIGQYDDIRGFVRSSDGPFAVMNCICRQGRDLLGEPCKQTHERENCLMLGPAAHGMVERGVARFVTRDEMLAMLDAADREGLVLQPQNMQRPMFVCCCCGCCCGVLTAAKKFPNPAEFFNANYYVDVDTTACQSCGDCASRCQMDAITYPDGPAHVDLMHCIGCGLCVSTCPSGAMRLIAKEQRSEPPETVAALYGKIFRERFGPWGMVKAVTRNALGLKV